VNDLIAVEKIAQWQKLKVEEYAVTQAQSVF